jgi:hypothetical protein
VAEPRVDARPTRRRSGGRETKQRRGPPSSFRAFERVREQPGDLGA